jgi:hypothetical protein
MNKKKNNKQSNTKHGHMSLQLAQIFSSLVGSL